MGDDHNPASIPADNPIRNSEDDVLNRAGIAEDFARHVLDLDVREGSVVSVFGSWGSGKTSFVNLARPVFEQNDVPVLDFNPWLFSGTDQLVRRFLAELSAQMKEWNGPDQVVEAIVKYADALSEPASTLADLLGGSAAKKIISALLNSVGKITHSSESIISLRKKIVDALKGSDKQMIVVIDDVDRLSGPEIREVFKLVRLAANFPNVIYVVPCDRLRVEQALAEPDLGLSGRDYVEKIVQWCFDLPAVPRHLLAQQLTEAIENVVSDIENPGPFDEQVWLDVREDIVRPLVSNIRDVRRYAMAIRDTVSSLHGRVSLVDTLALDAVRLFLPDVFRLVPRATNALAAGDYDAGFTSVVQRENHYKERVDSLLEAAGTDSTKRDVVNAMIARLFPLGESRQRMDNGNSDSSENDNPSAYLAGRRVAHVRVLRLYLERVVNPELLSYHNAEDALARMADPAVLDAFFRSLDQDRRPDVASNLLHLSNRFRQEHVVPGVVAMLNLLPDITEPSGVSPIRQVVLQLMCMLPNDASSESQIREMLDEVTSLSGKVMLVDLIALDDVGIPKVVSEVAAAKFQLTLRQEIRAKRIADLCNEVRLCDVLRFLKHTAASKEEPFRIDASPVLTFFILWSARGISTAGQLGTRVESRFLTLNWELLIQLFGGKEVVAARIDCLKAEFKNLRPRIEERGIPLCDARELIKLADKRSAESQSETD